MGLNFSQGAAFGNAVDKARARAREWEENAHEWEQHANGLEKQLNKVLSEKAKLQRIANKYHDIEGLLYELEGDPTVYSMNVIHGLKARALKHKSIEQHWGISRIREENLKLIAEAEYDYHVLADPVYRLSNAAEELIRIAKNNPSSIRPDEILSIASKLTQTSGIRKDEHREEFIKERIDQLKASVRYEHPLDFVPIIDSIPLSNLEETKEQDYDHWKAIQNEEHASKFLINK